MVLLVENETIYLLSDEKKTRFHELLQQNKHLSTYMGDFKRGYLFQYRLILDCFILLTTAKEDLLIDHYRTLERPVNTFIHDTLCKQYEIVKYKRMNLANEPLALTISIFMAKKITYEVYEHLLPRGLEKEENPLELINYSDRDIAPANREFMLLIQTKILKKIKERNLESSFLEKIVEQSIIEGKILHQFLEKGD